MFTLMRKIFLKEKLGTGREIETDFLGTRSFETIVAASFC